MKTVLFLCSGNYYRSRFAEYFFNHLAPQRGLAWRADSRGLALEPTNAGAMSSLTVNRLAELGIVVQPNERLPLDAVSEDFAAAAHIVAVKEAEHRPLMRRRFPQWLGQVEFWGVHDIDCAEPASTFAVLEREVQTLLERLSLQETRCA